MMSQRVTFIVSLFTLAGVLLIRTNSAQPEIVTTKDGQIPLVQRHPLMTTSKRTPGFVRIGRQGNFVQVPLVQRQPLMNTSKRTPGFVRIGRQGNFVRIGRANQFVRIGRNDHQASSNNGQSYTNTDVMPWYPLLHRFIRIGRHKTPYLSVIGDEEGIDDKIREFKMKKNNINMDIESLSYVNKQTTSNNNKRNSGFVRIGRGNSAFSGDLDKRNSGFVRIGRANSAFSGDLDKRNSGFVRIGRGKSAFSGDLNKRNSGFVRIGRGNSAFSGDLDKRNSGFVRIGKANSAFSGDLDKKNSGFVRIGRGKSDFPGDLDKRNSGFVRIGRGKSDFRGDLNFPLSKHGTEVKRASGFVRIGKSPEKYDDFINDDNSLYDNGGDASHSDSKRPSGFVRIGKNSVESIRKNLVNFYTHLFENALKEENNGIESSLGEDRAGVPLTTHFADNFETTAGISSLAKNDDTDENYVADDNDEGDDDDDNDEDDDDDDNDHHHNDSYSLNKRASGFVRIGKSDSNNDVKANEPFSGGVGVSDSVSSPVKRSYMPLAVDAGSSRRLEDADVVINSDSSMDGPNRRSAFVRIGKIPSSAFVRIGKNFDRVIRLPTSNRGRPYVRRGHSSFVRIG